MKKYIWSVVLSVLVGIFLGKLMLNQYDGLLEKVSTNIESEKITFFQVGVYSNLENMKNATSNYEDYVYMKKDDKYYVFLAITKDNKEKLKEYFESLNIPVYLKEIEINNSGFLENLNQYDLLLKNSKTNEEIKEVNKSVLAKYEELMSSD